tara:strand:- start:472 stop:870 length:399 start_codon:yes stop_codon:yes gene_type:complete
MKANPLIPIGTKIEVDKSKIETLLSNKLLDNLPQIINGEVVDYKMTDGKEIGYVLKTENNTKIWVFNKELNEQTRREHNIVSRTKSYASNNTNFFQGKYKINYELNGNRNIKTTVNPINLINWIVFTIKDIF